MYKRRRSETRCCNSNDEVEIAATEDVLTPQEVEQLGRFARAMKLDWGGLDVLRDRSDGRLYVVDVNKTDMGPPIAMALPDKITVTRKLADAFLAYIQAAPRAAEPAEMT